MRGAKTPAPSRIEEDKDYLVAEKARSLMNKLYGGERR
jgi:hypothetical protein